MRARGGVALLVCALLTASSGPALARRAARKAVAQEAPAPPALSKPPRLVHFVEATLPPTFTLNEPAEVVLTIDVNDAGKVQSVAVAKSAGDELDQAAEAAARQFVFEPGEADGKPVPVRITYSYRFVPKAPPPPPPPPPGAAAPAVPTVPLSGKVLRKGDRAPLAGVSVIAVAAGGGGGERRAVTDEGGHFSFDALPVGDYDLKLRSPTTMPADGTLTLHEGRALEATYYLESKERYASTVRGRRPVVETVEHTLSIEEVKLIPGTQGDTLKAVQNLPGVARAPFGIGLLVVWGSAPQDTRVYVDGVNIPVLYHFGGLRSTVNSEMVQSLTFVPGAYQADHGLGLGGLVEVGTRHPRSDGYHGYAQMDLVDGSLMLEGPITHDLSFAVAGRRSWIDATLPLFTSSSLQLSPVYYDYQARLAWRLTARDDIDFFMLGSDDRLTLVAKVKDDALTANVDSHIYYHRAIANWLHRWGNGATLTVTPAIGFDVPLQVGVAFGTVPTNIDTRTLGYSTRAVARVPVAPWLRLDAGLDYEGNRYQVHHTGIPAPSTDPLAAAGSGGVAGSGGFSGGVSGFATDLLTLYANALAPFGVANFTLLAGRLVVTPQLRLQIYTFSGYQGSPDAFTHAYFSPEPRLAARFKLSPRWIVKAAAGLYSQAPDPASLSQVFGNPALEPQRGVHYVLGAEFDVTRTLHVEFDGFWKSLSHLVVASEGPTGPLLDNDGVGRVYGGELLVRQELAHNFFGWLAYTLSRSERKDHPDESFHIFNFDQTHVLTLMGSYALPRGFQVGLRYRYVTGNPYTPIAVAFYDSNTDRYMPIQGTPGSARVGAFNQFDVRGDKTWTFNRWRFAIYLDVQNAFNASNPETVSYNFNFRIQRPITGLPILPVLGVRGDF
jgi:TonB family protein